MTGRPAKKIPESFQVEHDYGTSTITKIKREGGKHHKILAECNHCVKILRGILGKEPSLFRIDIKQWEKKSSSCPCGQNFLIGNSKLSLDILKQMPDPRASTRYEGLYNKDGYDAEHSFISSAVEGSKLVFQHDDTKVTIDIINSRKQEGRSGNEYELNCSFCSAYYKDEPTTWKSRDELRQGTICPCQGTGKPPRNYRSDCEQRASNRGVTINGFFVDKALKKPVLDDEIVKSSHFVSLYHSACGEDWPAVVSSLLNEGYFCRKCSLTKVANDRAYTAEKIREKFLSYKWPEDAHEDRAGKYMYPRDIKIEREYPLSEWKVKIWCPICDARDKKLKMSEPHGWYYVSKGSNPMNVPALHCGCGFKAIGKERLEAQLKVILNTQKASFISWEPEDLENPTSNSYFNANCHRGHVTRRQVSNVLHAGKGCIKCSNRSGKKLNPLDPGYAYVLAFYQENDDSADYEYIKFGVTVDPSTRFKTLAEGIEKENKKYKYEVLSIAYFTLGLYANEFESICERLYERLTLNNEEVKITWHGHTEMLRYTPYLALSLINNLDFFRQHRAPELSDSDESSIRGNGYRFIRDNHTNKQAFIKSLAQEYDD